MAINGRSTLLFASKLTAGLLVIKLFSVIWKPRGFVFISTRWLNVITDSKYRTSKRKGFVHGTYLWTSSSLKSNYFPVICLIDVIHLLPILHAKCNTIVVRSCHRHLHPNHTSLVCKDPKERRRYGGTGGTDKVRLVWLMPFLSLRPRIIRNRSQSGSCDLE